MRGLAKKIIALATVATMTATSLVGCAEKTVDNEAVVAVVGDSELKAGVANFYMRYQQSSMESTYESLLGDDMWSLEVSEGVTYEESVKESILESLVQYYVLEDHMSDYGVVLTEAELAAIDAAAQALVDANEAEDRALVSAEKEYVAEMLRLMTINFKMSEVMIADVNREVSDEEAAQKAMYYVAFKVAEDDKDGANAKKQAEEFLAKAKEDGNLESYAEKAEQKATKLTFDKDSTDLDASVMKAANALAEGEFSNIIETKDTVYVLQLRSLLDRTATDAEKENIIIAREDEAFLKEYETWKKDTKVEVHEDVLDQISFRAVEVTVKEKTEEK